MQRNAKKSLPMAVDRTAEKRPAPATTTTTKHVRFDISMTNSTASSYPPYSIHQQIQQQHEPADVSISSGFGNFFTTPRGYVTPAKEHQQINQPKKANAVGTSKNIIDRFSTSFSDMDHQEEEDVFSRGRDFLDSLLAKSAGGGSRPTNEQHQINKKNYIVDASSKNVNDDPLSTSILDLDMNTEQDVTFSKGDFLRDLFATTGGDAGPSKEQSFQFNFDNESAGGTDHNAPPFFHFKF